MEWMTKPGNSIYVSNICSLQNSGGAGGGWSVVMPGRQLPRRWLFLAGGSLSPNRLVTGSMYLWCMSMYDWWHSVDMFVIDLLDSLAIFAWVAVSFGTFPTIYFNDTNKHKPRPADFELETLKYNWLGFTTWPLNWYTVYILHSCRVLSISELRLKLCLPHHCRRFLVWVQVLNSCGSCVKSVRTA